MLVAVVVAAVVVGPSVVAVVVNVPVVVTIVVPLLPNVAHTDAPPTVTHNGEACSAAKTAEYAAAEVKVTVTTTDPGAT